MCSREKAYISINDAVFHVTDFLPLHPGSGETLLDHCGGDVTESFTDIGHSDHAISLMQSYCVLDPHRVYLQHDPFICNHLYNHLKMRSIPSITPLHEQMKTLQTRIACLPEGSGALSLLSGSDMPVFSEEFQLAPDLGGFLSCPFDDHCGSCRSFFDPLAREWVVWYSCCGSGKSLMQIPPEILKENVLKTIFENEKS
jgi:hypothetical protein